MKQTISNLISSFSKIRRFYAIELQKNFVEENLSPNEISILLFLSNNPTISTSRELTYFLEVSKGLISRSIDSLVKRGYVECTVDDKDHRVQHVKLTASSKTIVHRLQVEIEAINQRILAGISIEDLECTQKTISKIVEKFQFREE